MAASASEARCSVGTAAAITAMSVFADANAYATAAPDTVVLLVRHLALPL